MTPNLFEIVSADDAVKAILGTNPVRVFPFGSAPDKVRLPYAVWQTIGGEPENYIGDLPDLDAFVLQLDVYGSSATQARAAAEKLRDAVEPHAHVISWRGESKESETNNFRYSFDVRFLKQR